MNKLMKITSVLMAVLMVACCLVACAKDVTVTVNDAGTKTEIETKTEQTIAEVLKAAGITVGEKDETEPALDTQLTEEITEITVKRYAKVTVVKDGEEKSVELVGGTVEDAVKAAGITLGEGEETDADPKAYLKDGMTIAITKEVKVTLIADGETKEVATKTTTVQALLDEQKITLGADDEVSEKLDTKLADGMKITVKRVEYKEETVKETIDYGFKEEYSDSMAQGTSEVTQSGVEGERVVVYKVKYVDGKEDSKEKISEKVTKEAVDQITTYGTKQAQQRSGGSSGGGKTVTSKINYPDCNGSGHGYYEIHYSDGSVEYQEY